MTRLPWKIKIIRANNLCMKVFNKEKIGGRGAEYNPSIKIWGRLTAISIFKCWFGSDYKNKCIARTALVITIRSTLTSYLTKYLSQIYSQNRQTPIDIFPKYFYFYLIPSVLSILSTKMEINNDFKLFWKSDLLVKLKYFHWEKKIII